jgi:hypothetical protein
VSAREPVAASKFELGVPQGTRGDDRAGVSKPPASSSIHSAACGCEHDTMLPSGAHAGDCPRYVPHERPTVRPRFDVEDVRLLLAALHLYRDRNGTRDVRELYDRIERLSKEIDCG